LRQWIETKSFPRLPFRKLLIIIWESYKHPAFIGFPWGNGLKIFRVLGFNLIWADSLLSFVLKFGYCIIVLVLTFVHSHIKFIGKVQLDHPFNCWFSSCIAHHIPQNHLKNPDRINPSYISIPSQSKKSNS